MVNKDVHNGVARVRQIISLI